MPEKDHLRLTREELYNLVWAKPMTQVAQEFEISDRAMAKLCAKRQVPVPSRGYWARKKAGQSVPQLPLLAFAAKPAKVSKVRVEPAEGPAGKPKARSMFEERNRTIRTALKGFRNALSEAVDYTVRIDEWNCDYSFGLNSSYDPLHRDDSLSFLHESPFYEYRDLVLRGVLPVPHGRVTVQAHPHGIRYRLPRTWRLGSSPATFPRTAYFRSGFETDSGVPSGGGFSLQQLAPTCSYCTRPGSVLPVKKIG